MNYLELFSSSCREKPRLMALAQALLRQVTDLAACAASIEPGYAAENAVGVQLDAAGEMIGIPRPAGMSDADFRELIRMKRLLYGWDGTNGSVPSLLAAIQPGAQLTDHCDGTVTLVPAGALPVDAREVFPLPAGIGVLS